MASVGNLTKKRKANLKKSGKGRNSINQLGMKPSGPDNAEMGGIGSYIGSETDSWVSLVGGGALATFGILELINKRSKLGYGALALLGGGLFYRGIHGLLSPSDEMTEHDTGMEHPTASIQHLEGIKVEESIYIDRAPEELYDYWRSLENLPKIMSHVKSVEEITDNLSHWVVEAPLGIEAEWEAEIYIEKVGELISWRSVEDSEIDNAGSVHFEPEGDGCRVTVMLSYHAPAGKLADAFAALLGENPAKMVKSDLKKFKKVMEKGAMDSLSGDQTSAAKQMSSRKNGVHG